MTLSLPYTTTVSHTFTPWPQWWSYLEIKHVLGLRVLDNYSVSMTSESIILRFVMFRLEVFWQWCKKGVTIFKTSDFYGAQLLLYRVTLWVCRPPLHSTIVVQIFLNENEPFPLKESTIWVITVRIHIWDLFEPVYNGPMCMCLRVFS